MKDRTSERGMLPGVNYMSNLRQRQSKDRVNSPSALGKRRTDLMKDVIKTFRAALPEAAQTLRKSLRRRIVRARLRLTGADHDTRMQAERRLRGREQHDRVRRADAVIVSYPKCGRTWLRVMISRLCQQIYGLPADVVIEFDNLHHMDSRAPKLFFTHDTHIRDYTGHWDTKVDYYDRKVLLLVRDPRDVAVSQFFHWRFRTKAWKKDMNDYPAHGADCSVFDFVREDTGGLPRIIDFMNLWAREKDKLCAHLVIRYEDMRRTPAETLSEIAAFLEIPANAAQIAEAVEYASYENMKKKESDQSFQSSGGRLKPGDAGNPDSYKVRRAKVGGYRDYFDDAQLAEIDAMVTERLNPAFGYGASHPIADNIHPEDGTPR